MITDKKIGIYMDHSIAHLIEFSKESFETKTISIETIESTFTHEEKEDSLDRGERLMHNKEKQQQSEYYKKIAGSIKNYDFVLLFGPTTAKNELANLIKDNHHFEKIKVVVTHSDKMTENQMHAFVADYFQKADKTVIK